MQTKHPIQLSHQDLKAICEALQLLLKEDYATWGGLEHSIKALVGEDLVKAKERIDRHTVLRDRLTDIEFDVWKQELDDEHEHADAEEAARYANYEPEET